MPAPPIRRRHLPSLDGLRGVAILFVVAHHLMGTVDNPPLLGRLAHDLDLGTLGVRVFFAISGFLITSLLIDEQEQTGGVSLKRFYLRRTLRIFPAFYVYVAVVAALEAASLVRTNRGDFLHAVTYTMNWHVGDAGWYLGHSWSLSIEEQFYLLWPGVLVIAGRPRAQWILIVTMLVVPVLRVGTTFGVFPFIESPGETFATVADWLAAGALLALCRPLLRTVPGYNRLLANRASTWGLVAVVFAAYTAFDHWRTATATEAIAVLATVLFIDATVTHPGHTLARALNTRVLAYVGRVSYSLYLWQELFCNRSSPAWPARFPVNVVLAFVCAVASFHTVERPALRLRDRLERRLGWGATISAARAPG